MAHTRASGGEGWCRGSAPTMARSGWRGMSARRRYGGVSKNWRRRARNAAPCPRAGGTRAPATADAGGGDDEDAARRTTTSSASCLAAADATRHATRLASSSDAAPSTTEPSTTRVRRGAIATGAPRSEDHTARDEVPDP